MFGRLMYQNVLYKILFTDAELRDSAADGADVVPPRSTHPQRSHDPPPENPTNLFIILPSQELGT